MKGSITQNKDDLRDPQEKIHTQSKADTEMVNTIKINRIVSKQRCDRE